MYEWAVNALMVTCSHLELLYGKDACQVSWRWGRPSERLVPVSEEGVLYDKHEVMLVFDPWRVRHQHDSAAGSSATACSCEKVKR